MTRKLTSFFKRKKAAPTGRSRYARYAGFTSPEIPELPANTRTVTRNGRHVLIGLADRESGRLDPNFVPSHLSKQALAPR